MGFSNKQKSNQFNGVDGWCEGCATNSAIVSVNMLANGTQSSNINKLFGWAYEYGENLRELIEVLMLMIVASL